MQLHEVRSKIFLTQKSCLLANSLGVQYTVFKYTYTKRDDSVISERLRNLRVESGLSKRELVSMLPINYSTYANYESGYREPNSDILLILSKHFKVSIDYLLGVSDNKWKADEVAVLNEHEHEHIMKYRHLDMHGKELVDLVLQKEYERKNFFYEEGSFTNNGTLDGEWITHKVFQQKTCYNIGNYFLQESDLSYELLRFATTPVSEKADFCVKIEGDNMEPKICDGDIVFVKAAPRVEPDSVGIFVHEHKTYCSRLRIEPKNKLILLESLNRKTPPIKIPQPNDLITVGLVIGIAERVI